MKIRALLQNSHHRGTRTHTADAHTPTHISTHTHTHTHARVRAQTHTYAMLSRGSVHALKTHTNIIVKKQKCRMGQGACVRQATHTNISCHTSLMR